jgi:hypothetical protein
MVVRSHIFRLLAGFALVFQLALPFAQAQAAANGTDLASLICNPSGRAISADARAALKDLLTAVGEDVSDDGQTDQSPDCERCVTAHVAVTSPNTTIAAPTAYQRLTSERLRNEALGPITVRGPPCGTRAPPIFV